MRKDIYLIMGIFILILMITNCAKKREQPTQAACIPHVHNWNTDCNTCHKDWNLIAMHDATSSSYNSNCVLCHGNMQCSQTLNPSIPDIHVKMIKYILETTNSTSITDTTCTHCHTTVDLLNYSAGNIRRQVSIDMCDKCHGPHGPGEPLYLN